LIYNKRNFHNATFCIWTEIDFNEIQNLKLNHTSKSGSGYIFNKEGVFRISNHWGRVSNCRWRLLPLTKFKNQYKIVAFAKWENFFSNDERAKLFYITVEIDSNKVDFQHAQNKNYSGKEVIRNTNDTAKIIRLITYIFKDTSWAKHLNYTDYLKLQKEVIYKLVYEERSWISIKQDYL
jgi:hypothetical protein